MLNALGQGIHGLAIPFPCSGGTVTPPKRRSGEMPLHRQAEAALTTVAAGLAMEKQSTGVKVRSTRFSRKRRRTRDQRVNTRTPSADG